MSKINLSKNFIRSICKSALNEDLYPSGDISSNLLKNNVKKKVKLISNQSGIIGGLEFVKGVAEIASLAISAGPEKAVAAFATSVANELIALLNDYKDIQCL